MIRISNLESEKNLSRYYMKSGIYLIYLVIILLVALLLMGRYPQLGGYGKTRCFDCEREAGEQGNPTKCFDCEPYSTVRCFDCEIQGVQAFST
jgi:hypothetical protein